MSTNKISFELTQENHELIAQRIRDVDAELGFAINLTPEERRNYSTMGDKTFTFVDKTIHYLDERQDLRAPYVNITELKQDMKLAQQLKELLLLIEPVVEKISDTYLAAGTDAFEAARKIYSYIKTASEAGAPGTDVIAAELGKRYVRKSSTTQEEKAGQQRENTESKVNETKES